MNSPATLLPEFLAVPATQQNPLVFFIISLIIISPNPTKSQSLSSSPTTDSPDAVTNFQPSLAVVIGVLAIMFSLTFLLLVYAKCCHRSSSLHYLNQENLGDLPRSLSRVSGVDKTVIESLPFFRFSTLKGWRNGLECSICLSKFEDIEILRLLPKCKHAFHIDCVDQWLEKHSGCPLCRCKVSEDDAAIFAYSSSLRFLSNQSEGTQEGSNLNLFIEREGSARFGSGRSVRKIEEENIQEIFEDEDQGILHKFNHRIVISGYDHDLNMKNRWSNVSSSDLMFLKSEMIDITSMSSNGHVHDQDHRVVKIKEAMERKREFERKIKKFPGGETDIGSSNGPKSTKFIDKRSMSEIVVHPRFLGVESITKEGNSGEISVKEERLRRLWLPIAQRTLQWFANRDQQPQINTNSQV